MTTARALQTELVTGAACILAGCASTRSPDAAPDLHVSAQQGDLRAVAQLVAAGADVNARDERQATPLHYALSLGRRPLAEWLLQHGACSATHRLKSKGFHL